MCERCTEQGRETQLSIMQNREDPNLFMIVMQNVTTGENMAIVADLADIAAIRDNLADTYNQAVAEIAERN